MHAYVPMSFAPGEAYQFDWSHETITLQGLPLTVKAAHMKLSHSRMPFVRVYFRETQELVFVAHDKAFQFYGGVCRRGIYDNSRQMRSICRCEDCGGSDLRRQGAPLQRSLSPDVLSPSDRTSGLHARVGLGERRGARTRSAICATRCSARGHG